MHTQGHDNILKNAGLRYTKARLQILDVLCNSNRAVNHEDITDKITEPIDKVTIYRTLEKFVTADIVHKAFMKDRTWYFELAHNCTATQCHPHFTCKKCNKTTCLKIGEVPMLHAPANFDIHHQKVLLEGICDKCNLAETNLKDL